MKMEAVQKIADAVLYEGHLLYPYRASALKNRKRWNFGVLVPESCQSCPESDPCWTQTECLVQGNEFTTIEVKVRFLHLVRRRVAQLLEPMNAVPLGPPFQFVDSLLAGDQTVQSFDETMERELDVPVGTLNDLLSQRRNLVFSFPPACEWHSLKGAEGTAVGLVIREQDAITATLEMTALRLSGELFKVTLSVCNRTPVQAPLGKSHEDLLPVSLIATHAIFAVEQGAFLSLIDPPESASAHAKDCHNVGAWPVLAGKEGDPSMLLSAPIILYDYPEIAPESPGDFFDGTEIDEILALRVQTLTDGEKQEMRLTDKQTQSVLERADRLPAEHLWKLHGVLKGLRPTEKAS
jgi:hypothetical protein